MVFCCLSILEFFPRGGRCPEFLSRNIFLTEISTMHLQYNPDDDPLYLQDGSVLFAEMAGILF